MYVRLACALTWKTLVTIPERLEASSSMCQNTSELVKKSPFAVSVNSSGVNPRNVVQHPPKTRSLASCTEMYPSLDFFQCLQRTSSLVVWNLGVDSTFSSGSIKPSLQKQRARQSRTEKISRLL